MKQHIQNAAYGLLDYASYPVAMLAVMPMIVRGLGTTHFGIWAFVMAIINMGAVLGSGFGDANIQQIAVARTHADSTRIGVCITTTLSIHLLLGTMMAVACLMAAPVLARHVASGSDISLCTRVLQIGAGCILIRVLETVVVSTQRAFERYGEAVRISAMTRVLSVASAGLLAVRGGSLVVIVATSGLLLMLGTAAQFFRLTAFVSPRCLIPGFDGQTGSTLLKIGGFTWLQAAGAAAFGQVDRILVGVLFGAGAVGAYSICMQLTQPISGSAASALHFVFPALARANSSAEPRMRGPITAAFACNLAIVFASSGLSLILGSHLLHYWTNSSIEAVGLVILPWAVLGSACAGIATTGIYAMLALGRPAAVVCATISSGAAMLITLAALHHHYGVFGVALSRVVFGFTSLTVYIPLLRLLRREESRYAITSSVHVGGVQEGV